MSMTDFDTQLDNERRALEGEAAVLMSADALANDPYTAAVDTIANILHFCTSLGMNPGAMLEAARTCYLGDLEDGHAAQNRFPNGDAMESEFKPRPEAIELLRQRLAGLSK